MTLTETENCTKLVKQGLFNNFMFHDTLSWSCNDAGTIPTIQTFVLFIVLYLIGQGPSVHG